MTARQFAAVPGGGQPGPEEEVRERPRLLAGVSACVVCGAAVRKLGTVDGEMVFEAGPVPLTAELVAQGGAYLMVRPRPGLAFVINARGVAAGALAGIVEALAPHVHTSHAENASA